MGNYIDIDYFQKFTKVEYTTETTPTATEVNVMIDEAEAEINENTGRTWGTNNIVDELYDCPTREILLKNYPVISVTSIKDTNLNLLVEGIDNDYIIDGDFVVFNPRKSYPSRCYVTYDSGYLNVRAIVKKLVTLLVVQKMKQSDSFNDSNSSKIKVGPISIDKSLGTQTIVNLDADINKYWSKLRSLIR